MTKYKHQIVYCPECGDRWKKGEVGGRCCGVDLRWISFNEDERDRAEKEIERHIRYQHRGRYQESWLR